MVLAVLLLGLAASLVQTGCARVRIERQGEVRINSEDAQDDTRDE